MYEILVAIRYVAGALKLYEQRPPHRQPEHAVRPPHVPLNIELKLGDAQVLQRGVHHPLLNVLFQYVSHPWSTFAAGRAPNNRPGLSDAYWFRRRVPGHVLCHLGHRVLANLAVVRLVCRHQRAGLVVCVRRRAML